MTALRALVHGCPLVLLTLLSCDGGNGNYPGAPCSSIPLGPAPAWLKLGTPGQAADPLGLPTPYVAFTHDVGCCLKSPNYDKPSDCGSVDCAALTGRLMVAGPAEDFPSQPCGAPTQPFGPRPAEASCTVYLDGAEIVAVNAFCPN